MKKSFMRTLIGIVVVAIGAGFLLDAFEVVNFSTLANEWWPLLIIAAGFASYISNPRVFVWPLALITSGVLLQLRALEMVEIGVWQAIWPVAIIAFGLTLLMSKSSSSSKSLSKDNLDVTAVFSGLEVSNSSKDFQGGEVTAIFGGADVDLRDSVIKGEATVEVFTAFGGVEIKVPEEWSVTTDALPLFGGIEDSSKAPKKANGPKLRIRGTCVFGGVEIKN